MGDDGNIILYNINNYQQSNIKYHDEILVKQILLKQQVIKYSKTSHSGHFGKSQL
jgi:hypothetical protein